MEILKIIGFGLLGILFYAVFQVWGKIKQEGFNYKKFFSDNEKFWIVGLILIILIAITVTFVPDIDLIISKAGFNIDKTPAGWVLLGYAIGGGTDNTSISGSKKINKL